MSQLDKLIERIQPGQDLLLESQKEPMMRSTAGLKTMVNQQLTSAQIIALIAELAPADQKQGITQKKPATFEYHLGGKRYAASFLTQGELVRGVVSLADAAIAKPPVDVDEVDEEETVEVISAEPMTAPRQTPSAGGGDPEINALLRRMFEMGASDLHLTSTHKPLIRLHGDMQDLPGQTAITPERLKKIIHSIMPAHNAAQFEEFNDTDFAYEIEDLARFRVNVFMDRFGIGAVFRQIPMEIVTAEKLGLSKEVLDLCFLSKGLVLVTGPTGSGKSTTLCALIDYINRNRKDHIITIEDPIEFVHKDKKAIVTQREIGEDTVSYAEGLKMALRQDPDVILIGEMRDLETTQAALTAALTGHLVFGTLHTTDAIQTISRVVDLFPPHQQPLLRVQLAESLRAVVSQRLLVSTKGGRVPAVEILINTPHVRKQIEDNKSVEIIQALQKGQFYGMQTFNQSLVKLFKDGLASEAEVLSAASSPDDLKLALRGIEDAKSA